MSGIVKGIILGAINVCVISLGFGIAGGFQLGVICAIFGAVPGLIAGGSLGMLATLLEKQHRLIRVGVLVVPAVLAVFGLASEFDLMTAAKIASIPTIILGLILERWTRYVPPAPRIPVAQLT